MQEKKKSKWKSHAVPNGAVITCEIRVRPIESRLVEDGGKIVNYARESGLLAARTGEAETNDVSAKCRECTILFIAAKK